MLKTHDTSGAVDLRIVPADASALVNAFQAMNDHARQELLAAALVGAELVRRGQAGGALLRKVTEDEAELLTAYRTMSTECPEDALCMVQSLAKSFPSSRPQLRLVHGKQDGQ